MNIFNLPGDITGKEMKPGGIIFHNYSAKMGGFKGKCMLNMNAISLVISGEKTMHFAEKIVNIKDDEFHFLSTGNCLVSMKLYAGAQFKSMLIFFEDNLLTNFYLKYDHIISTIKNRQKIQYEPYLAFKKDGFILNFIDSLNLLFQCSSGISTEMKQIKFEELMLYLLKKYPLQILSFQNAKNKKFNDFEIRKIVETNVMNNISLKELAFLCNISLSTFKRYFVKIYKMPPNKWMLQKRMELARNLLQHNEKPSEVFHKVGYENHSSFSQSFKQTFGVTPRAFQMQE